MPGETLQYTISITNAGPSDAQNAVLLDATPAVFLNPEYSTDGGTTWNPWITPLNLGTLVAGASRTVLLRGTLSPFATDTITNTAVVEALTPDPNPDNNTDTALTPIQPSADLSILKTASPSPVLVGGRIEYLLTVSNAGPSPAENTVVTDILPTGLTDAEISTDNGMTWLPFDGTASVGTLAVGGSIQLLLRARVPASTAESLVNTAIVASDTPDPNPDNNTFTVDTPVLLSADLAMVKTAASATVTPGGTLAYVLTISNAGPADAQNVMVFDTPPAELFDVEYSLDGGGTWLPWAGTLIWGTLPAGAAETILLRGTVAFSASGVLENTAVVSSDTPDPNPVNNTDTSTTIVEAEAEADVGITKSTLAAQAVPGENLTYTILVANAGPDAAEDVTLYDALPSELLDGMFSTDNGVTWQVWRSPYVLGTLEAGEIVTLLLRGTVSDAACGSLANTAVVSSSTPDPNPENNTATVEIPVLPPVLGGADLAVQKTAFPNPVCCGQCITFTLTVVNAGPMTAENTVLTDTLPMGLCGAIYSVDFGRTWSPWTGVYEAGNLAAGETVTVLLRANVGACAGCCVVNIASVSSSTTDPFLDNNIAHTAVVVCECRCREKSDGCNNKRFSTDNGV